MSSVDKYNGMAVFSGVASVGAFGGVVQQACKAIGYARAQRTSSAYLSYEQMLRKKYHSNWAFGFLYLAVFTGGFCGYCLKMAKIHARA